MRKLTQHDLSRPKVTLILTGAQLAQLPRDLQMEILACVNHPSWSLPYNPERAHDWPQFSVVVPCYIADDFERAATALGGGTE